MKQEQTEIIERLDRMEKGNQPRPLTFDEAADYLGISKSYLYKLTSQRRIPHYKPEGKRVYFTKSELDDWMLRNPIPTRQQIERKAIDRLAKPWRSIGGSR